MLPASTTARVEASVEVYPLPLWEVTNVAAGRYWAQPPFWVLLRQRPLFGPGLRDRLVTFLSLFLAKAGRCGGPDGGVTTQNNTCVDTQALPESSLQYSTGVLYYSMCGWVWVLCE